MSTATNTQFFTDRNFAWLSGLWSPSVPTAGARGEESVTLWQRMRLNAATVRPLLHAAGITADGVRNLRCRPCGLWENASFWTLSRHEKGILHLRCPACGNGVASYNLARNEAASRSGRPRLPIRYPLGTALLIALGLLLIGSLKPGAVAAVKEQLGATYGATTGAVPVAGTAGTKQGTARTGASGRGTAWWQGLTGGGAPAEAQYLLPGDRRDEVLDHARALAAENGWEGSAGLHSVVYVAELGRTRVMVNAKAGAWKEYLERTGSDAAAT